MRPLKSFYNSNSAPVASFPAESATAKPNKAMAPSEIPVLDHE